MYKNTIFGPNVAPKTNHIICTQVCTSALHLSFAQLFSKRRENRKAQLFCTFIYTYLSAK